MLSCYNPGKSIWAAHGNMSFASPYYYLLLLCVFPLYWVIPAHGARKALLVLASFLFYSFWDYRFFPLLLVSGLSDYLFSRRIHTSDNEKVRRLLLFGAVCVNLGILGYFKYSESFRSWAWALTHGHGAVPPDFSTILPLGISFYTFQTMGFTLDVYRRKTNPMVSFWDYFLFVSYFPQLVAGPIERAQDLLPQLLKKQRFDAGKASKGALLVGSGLFLKLIIADSLGTVVNLFLKQSELNGVLTAAALLGFGYQIYTDFWSYTLIARGSSLLFGVELSRNFEQPYLSASPREFWRRWHISLSVWFRDNLYIPLGGNRRFEGRNLIFTMAVAGLWHGSSVLFVLWGLYHGLLLVLQRLYWPTSFLGPLCTFVTVQFGWIFFRAQSMEQLKTMLNSLGNFSPAPSALHSGLGIAASCIGITMLIDFFLRWDPLPGFRVPETFRFYARFAIASSLVMLAVFYGETIGSAFIYFNF